MDKKNRIKLRVHHVHGLYFVKQDAIFKAYTSGVSGRQMWDHQKRLKRLFHSNPKLEIEITDDYDGVCSFCPRGPNRVPYIPPKKVYTFNKLKDPLYWAEKEKGVWNEPCNNSKEGERRFSLEHLGLAIGTIINARQLIRIQEIYNKYFGYYRKMLQTPYEELAMLERKDLIKFYMEEGLLYHFQDLTSEERKLRAQKTLRETLLKKESQANSNC